MKALAAALLGLAALAGCTGGGGATTSSAVETAPTVAESGGGGVSWPLFGVDPGRSNVFAGPTGITAANVGRLGRSRVALPGTADSSPIALPSGLLVVTTSYGKAAAIDPRSGTIAWTFVPDGIESWEGSAQITQASPAYGNGYVYSYSPDGRVHKLDAGTGMEVRSQGWPAAVTTDPAHEKSAGALNLAHALVLVGTGGYFGDAPPYQGSVVALDAGSGRVGNVFNALCSDRTSLDLVACPESGAAVWGRGGVVVEPGSGNLLVSTGNGAWDGSRYWGDSVLALASDGGRLLHSFTPSDQGRLAAGDLDLGSASPALVPLSPGGQPRFVLQGGKEGVLYLLDAATLDGSGSPGGQGGALATIAAPGGAGVFAAPAVWPRSGSAIAFVATAAGTTAYTVRDDPPRIEALWQNGTAGTSPVLAGGLLYVYDPGGALNVYDPDSGHRIATLPAGSGHWSSPIVVRGVVALPEGNANEHATEGMLDLYAP